MMEERSKERPALIIYGHDYCSQAHMLYHTLEEHGVDYELRDILKGDPSWKGELRALARGHLSVPTVVFSDGSVMVEPWPRSVIEKLGLAAE